MAKRDEENHHLTELKNLGLKVVEPMANTNKGVGVEPPREPGQELEGVKKPYKDMVVGPLNQKPDMATPTPVR